MRKVIISIILTIIFILPVFCLRNVNAEAKPVHEFDSQSMLDNHYKEIRVKNGRYKDVTISLLTVSKEDPLYSWFGHSAILVEDKDHAPMMYDYGRFAFGKKFYVNFAMGRLWYNCSAFIARYELEDMEDNERTISKVVLNLTPSQKKAIIDFLNVNSKDPYNVYLYHHYNDNCATRIRDIIDRATDGEFRKWAKAQDGYTYRESTSMILHNNIPCNWALDFLQSGNIDRKNTRWEQMFLPAELEKALLEFNTSIVGEHSYISDFRETTDRPADYSVPQNCVVQSLVFGLVIALTAVLLKNKNRALGVYSFTVDFIFGLLGCLLFFMMFFTSHDVTWNNENILFINPLLFVASFLSLKTSKHRRLLRGFYVCEILIAAVLCVLKYLYPQIFIQQNMAQLTAIIPYYTVMAVILK